MSAVMPLPNNLRALDDSFLDQDRIVTYANRVLEQRDPGRLRWRLANKQLRKIGPDLYVTFSGNPPAWLEPIAERLHTILGLDDDRDCYPAGPVRAGVAADVLRFLANSMENETPIPTLMPTVQGGIQTEWHTHDFDLEIEYSPDGYYSVYFDDGQGEFDTLEILANENPAYDLVVELVDRVTERVTGDSSRIAP